MAKSIEPGTGKAESRCVLSGRIHAEFEAYSVKRQIPLHAGRKESTALWVVMVLFQLRFEVEALFILACQGAIFGDPLPSISATPSSASQASPQIMWQLIQSLSTE